MSELDLKRGAIAVRLHLFDSPEEEVARVLTPPWPNWMRRLYELEALAHSAETSEEGLETPTMRGALHALADRLRRRLELLAFVVGAMEELGWEAMMESDAIVLSKVIASELAVEELEQAGVYGPMVKVAELDEKGLPRLLRRWEME
jgi:hypothetical protein